MNNRGRRAEKNNVKRVIFFRPAGLVLAHLAKVRAHQSRKRNQKLFGAGAPGRGAGRTKISVFSLRNRRCVGAGAPCRGAGAPTFFSKLLYRCGRTRDKCGAHQTFCLFL